MTAQHPSHDAILPRNLTPGLSTGSLIAIAVIVLLCSGGYGAQRSISNLEQQVHELRQSR